MKIDQQWLRKEIRKSILKEAKNYQSMDEGFASMAGGLVDAAGNLVSNLSPAAAKKMTNFAREAIIRKLSDTFDFDINSNLGIFLVSLINELSFKEMGQIWEGDIECDDLVTSLSGIASRMLTRKAIHSLMVWLLQHYDLNDLTNFMIEYDVGGTKGKYTPTLVSAYKNEQIPIDQADRILNSLIGMGISYIIEGFVRDFVIDNIVPEVAKYLCDNDISDIADDFEELDDGGMFDTLTDTLTDTVTDVATDVSTSE
jgi:hypothetical protein